MAHPVAALSTRLMDLIKEQCELVQIFAFDKKRSATLQAKSYHP